MTLAQFGLDKLSDDEKRQVRTLLDESLVAPDRAPWETPEFLAELQRRVEDARANPGTGIPAEEVYRAAVARSRARRGL